MERSGQGNFWFGVLAGFVVMVIVQYLVPFAGAVIGGFAAGWLVHGGGKKGGQAGLYAGLLDAVLVAGIISFAGVASAPNDVGLLAFLGSTLIVTVVLFPLYGLLGLFGGYVAGAWRG